MAECFYPKDGRKYFPQLKELKPELFESFMGLNEKIFADGSLSTKMKELIAVAVAHTTRCPYCIESHIQKAQKAGATQEEIAESIFVAVALNAGAAFAHSIISLESLNPR